jgi:hypothetical protein
MKERKIEVTGRRGRRRKQQIDYLEETRGYWKLKEEALDSTLWKTGVKTDYKVNEWMNEWEMNYGLVLYVDCVPFLPHISQFIASFTVSFHSRYVTFTSKIASLITKSLKSECHRPNRLYVVQSKSSRNSSDWKSATTDSIWSKNDHRGVGTRCWHLSRIHSCDFAQRFEDETC